MGSFWRRYPFGRPWADRPQVVEAWTKGNVDRLITFESLTGARVMTEEEVVHVKNFVRKIAIVIYEEFAARGLHVLDGKIELGRLKGGDGQIVLIDEISPDVLRVCKGYQRGEKGCARAPECISTRISGEDRKISARNQLPASELEKIFLK
jgi:phosphoribosylaminoimidazole-succinocarboxamide synthase